MIWAILLAVGVPLWLCAAGILTLVVRNRALRTRPGNIPVRVLAPGKHRWRAGHGVWVHDVFAFRGSPAVWSESLVWATAATPRAPTTAERAKLHRIGDAPVVATIALAEGGELVLAARADDEASLLGPFAGVVTT
jgi:hypothetical protein